MRLMAWSGSGTASDDDDWRRGSGDEGEVVERSWWLAAVKVVDKEGAWRRGEGGSNRSGKNTPYCLEEQIRRLDCRSQYAVLSGKVDTSYPTGGYGISVDLSEQVIFMDTAYVRRWIRRIGNCEHAFTCEDLALIRNISFPGYGVLVVKQQQQRGLRELKRGRLGSGNEGSDGVISYKVDPISLEEGIMLSNKESVHRETRTEREEYFHLIQNGELDIIIGTHSLLGSRVTYDKLAPPQRVPIKTHLSEYSEEKVISAINFELDRGGQVFYVLPRIQGLEQLYSKRLEKTMTRFVDGEIKILVSTNIVESGLDIQNANTIIIQDFQQFGLAQLYQLRGRVGRSNKEAHAHLYYPNKLLLSPEAKVFKMIRDAMLSDIHRNMLEFQGDEIKAELLIDLPNGKGIQRERHAVLGEGVNGKTILRPIISFQSWRIGILFFAFGNALNFISFGYAAQQSLLAALGSVQFVSNIAFAYVVLNKTVTVKVVVATTFIVLGNTFLVAFGNHQSPVYTQDQLAEKYSNITFLFYCLLLVVVVIMHHYVYRRGEWLLSMPGKDFSPYWKLLIPFSYAVVSGAIGSCSVLFAKSLSNLLRLSMSSSYRLDSWFTYSILLLFLCNGYLEDSYVYFGNDFSIHRDFVAGTMSQKVCEAKDSSLSSATLPRVNTEVERLIKPIEDSPIKDLKSFMRALAAKASAAVTRAKSTCTLLLVWEMMPHAWFISFLPKPMVFNKNRRDVNGLWGDRSKLMSLRSPTGWSRIPVVEESVNMLETTSSGED
ncbi:probable magnesium transporter NIPA8 [Tanacetum coccineum]